MNSLKKINIWLGWVIDKYPAFLFLWIIFLLVAFVGILALSVELSWVIRGKEMIFSNMIIRIAVILLSIGIFYFFIGSMYYIERHRNFRIAIDRATSFKKAYPQYNERINLLIASTTQSTNPKDLLLWIDGCEDLEKTKKQIQELMNEVQSQEKYVELLKKALNLS